ncbi:30S ribosomal protein S6 [Patescibacteria group bacterium]|nr:30S ribosomal protein S6 [Patescibacteria group bacterium]
MSTKESKKYELIIALKPTLPENVRLGTQKKLEGMIKENGFKIFNTDVWGKRYLAFPINKHQEGYYIIYKVEKDLLQFRHDDISKFSKALSLLSEVIRYGIFSLKEYTMIQSQSNI